MLKDCVHNNTISNVLSYLGRMAALGATFPVLNTIHTGEVVFQYRREQVLLNHYVMGSYLAPMGVIHYSLMIHTLSRHHINWVDTPFKSAPTEPTVLKYVVTDDCHLHVRKGEDTTHLTFGPPHLLESKG